MGSGGRGRGICRHARALSSRKVIRDVYASFAAEKLFRLVEGDDKSSGYFLSLKDADQEQDYSLQRGWPSNLQGLCPVKDSDSESEIDQRALGILHLTILSECVIV